MPASRQPALSPGRIAAVDVARGAAIVAMVVYHCAWDLSFLYLVPWDISVDEGWIWFQRAILGTFLFLVGTGLVLAHGAGIRWRAFWRRTLVIAAAAAAMSLGTFLAFGDAFSFFGVLHAIVLFSIAGLAFLRVPVPLVLLAAAIFLAPPAFLHAEPFNVPWLAWIGFWTVPPRTADLVPVFPWFGAVLLGIAATRAAVERGLISRLAAWTAAAQPFRLLALAGRWSLLVYLVHQPLLLAVLYPLALWLQPALPEPVQLTRETGFLTECRTSCVESGGVAGYCEAYCACALDQVVTGDLWAAVEAPMSTPERATELEGIISLCRKMAE